MTLHRPSRLFGAGGGGKKGGGPKEAKNSLLSRQEAYILDVLGEGPILGLVDGAKSIFLDEVPHENSNGTKNHEGFEWEFRSGEASQEPTSILDATESEHPVNVLVGKVSGPVIQAVTETDLDAFRVRIRLPQLMKVNDDGEIKATNVRFSIEWALGGSGNWNHITGSPFTISGKNNAAFYRDYEFTPPVAGPWQIRVTRLTDDDDTAKITSAFYFDAWVGIIKQKFIYPYSAYVAFKVDAEQFGTQIPARTFDVYGRIVRVPTNFNGTTREYTGFWDGSFKLAWTDDPAWCFLDMATNRRYGAGLDDSEVNIATLYEISKYSSEKVPDGKGDFEFRYSLNVAINTREDAYGLLKKLITVFRGMMYWASGQVSLAQDRPKEVRYMASPANTENGMFVYRSTSDESRANTVYVSYNNPQEGYKPDIEIVEYPDDIRLRGTRITEIQAWGCSSQGQARRVGEWYLYTQHHDTETVSYTAGMDHDDIYPGDLIAIHDPAKTATLTAGGRIIATSGNTVTLDRPLELAIADTQIMLSDNDKRMLYFNVTAASVDRKTLTLSGTSPVANIDPHNLWMAYKKDTKAREYVVTSVPQKGGRRVVTALLYNRSKFAHVERNVPLETPPVDPIQPGQLKPPALFTYTTYRVERPGTRNSVNLLLSWAAPSQETRIAFYRLQMKESDTDDWETIYEGRESSYAVTDLDPTDPVDVRIQSVGSVSSMISPWQTISNIELSSRAVPPAGPSAVRVIAQDYGKGLRVEWDLVKPADFLTVEIYRSITNNVEQATFVAQTPGSFYIDTNLEANQFYYYWVRVMVLTDNPAARYSPLVGPVFAATLPTPSMDVLDGSITAAKLANAAVTADKIMNEAITSIKLAEKAVKALNIDDAAVTAAKIADNAVGANNLRDGIIDATKFAASIKPIEIGTSLPTTGNTVGRTFYNTTDGATYTWNGTEWTKPETGIADGSVTASKIADGAVTANKIANEAINASKFAASIKPVEIVNALPTTGNVVGRVVYLTTDSKLYRYTPSGWVSTVAASDITGQIEAAKIAAIEAEKITGQIVGTQISDNAITTPKLAASAVVAGKIAAGAIETDKLAAGAVTTGKLAALSVTADILAANAVTAGKIAAAAVSTDQLAANAVTAAKIAAAVITGDKLVANSITARELVLTDYTNLVTNGSFLQDMAGWDEVSSNATRIARNVDSTTNAVKTMPSAFAVQMTPVDTTTTILGFKDIPVRSGSKFHVQYDYASGGAVGAVFGVYVQFSDADGNVAAAAHAVQRTTNMYSWQTAVGEVTVPANAVSVRYIYARRQASATGGTVYVTNINVLRKNNAELIVDGAITANHLSAGSVTADAIAANAITAGKIAAGAVSAAQLAANAITADKIAAGAVSTDKLSVGIGGNLFMNTAFTMGTDFWGFGTNGGSTTTISVRKWPETFAGPNANTLMVFQNTAAGQVSNYYANVSPDNPAFYAASGAGGPNRIGVTAGQVLELQTKASAHRCVVRLVLQAYDADNNYVGGASGTVANGGAIDNQQSYNNDPDRWPLIFIRYQVPANAVSVIPTIQKMDTNVGATSPNSFMFLYHPMLSFVQSLTNAEPAIYREGGVSIITGGAIVADAIKSIHLSAGAVTADAIAANAITAAKIQGGAITGDKIAGNTIAGDKMVANAITARELVLTDYANMVPNGYFDDISGGVSKYWTIPAQSNLHYNNAGLGLNGQTALVLQKTVATASISSSSVQDVSVSGGEIFTGEVCVHTTGSAVGQGFYYRVLWYDINKNMLASPNNYTDIVGNGAMTTSPTVFTRKVTAPTAARFAKLQIINHSTNTTNVNAIISYLSLRRANAATLIVDGSIVASHMAANSIQAGAIAANAVTAEKINVSQLSAISSNLGAVTAGSLNINNLFVVASNGTVTIRNATSGNRLIITNSRIEVYDATRLRVRLGIW